MVARHSHRGYRAHWWIVWVSLGLWLGLASLVHAESIESFSVDLVLTERGELAVNETIIYDFGSADRHGIFREVLPEHALPASVWYKDRYIRLRPVSVTRNGAQEPFVNEASEGLYLRIGDPDRTITGEHTYEITYIAEGALSEVDGITELNWNVTGTWPVRMRNVDVTLAANTPVILGSQGACYAGAPGATIACDEFSFNDSLRSSQARFFESSLAPGEELTIAQVVTLTNPPLVLERVNWVPFWLGAIMVWFIALLAYVIRWRYQHKTGNPIIARYEPYQDFLPMFTGVLFDKQLDPRDISAGIVYLAEQGFITIKHIEQTTLFFFETADYEVTLQRPLSEATTEFQRTLLKLLFVGQEAVDPDEPERGFSFSLSNGKSITEMMKVETVPIGKSIRLSALRRNQSKLRFNQKLLKELRRSVERDLLEKGFIEQRMNRTFKGVMVGVVTVAIIFGVQITAIMSAPVALTMLFIGLNGFIILLLATERRTARGFEALDHLKGFKDYLSVTEKERYKFHNAPALSPQEFMRHLPYAVAFGVEKEWAEVFEGISIGSPDWYASDVPNARFNAVAFTSELSSFSAAFRSSTGSSGSSGGGSAGGGSGGGGGGSW